MRRLPLLISLVALVGVVVLFFRTSTGPGARQGQPSGHAEKASGEADVHEEHVEVAVYMGRIQRFHQKWWLAGREGNAELSAFYLHEMEEAMEVIADGHVTDEGVDISAEMAAYGPPLIKDLEKVLAEQGVAAMHARASDLVDACNSCHLVTKHGYIRIKVPEAVSWPDQDFAPVN